MKADVPDRREAALAERRDRNRVSAAGRAVIAGLD